MTADQDGDSQMLSSPSENSDNGPGTPQGQTMLSSSSSILSPPSSGSQPHETRGSNPTSAPSASIANSNGKRPLQTISNGLDEELPGAGTASTANAERLVDHPAAKTVVGGYSYTRAEDAPGWSWLNKKALDEYHRAVDGLVHQEIHVGSASSPILSCKSPHSMLTWIAQMCMQTPSRLLTRRGRYIIASSSSEPAGHLPHQAF